MSAALCVRDLAKSYGAVAALRGVSFEVAPGEIFGLLGPNGAGKTTAIECILGLRRADAGAIAIGGIDALANPQDARQRVGAQLQATALQDKITPRQALTLFAAFYRRPVKVEELIARFGLSEKAGATYDSLSGGQRQRLALALAFVNDPTLVFLDEPTAGLDPSSRRELHGMILDLRAAGRTVVLSTHDLAEAQSLCDRIGLIDRGSLVAQARPDELIAGAKTPPRVAVRTARELSRAQVQALTGVVEARPRNDGWELDTFDVNRTVMDLAGVLAGGGNELLDLQIHRPTLEDVFIELTGRTWEDEGLGASATGLGRLR